MTAIDSKKKKVKYIAHCAYIVVFTCLFVFVPVSNRPPSLSSEAVGVGSRAGDVEKEFCLL